MSEIVVLSVPLKKGWDVDIVKPLKNMISSTSDKKEDYTDAISTLSTMRHIALKLGEKSDASLEHMAKYYDQLSNLSQKIPTQELQIPFKWQDAFSKGSVFGGRITLTVSSISYEMVSTLFNYAAMCTQIAAVQNLESEEGLKKANKHLQTAAGIFNQLKDRVVAAIEQEPTPDLEPETLTLLSAICLAQAQELVVQKALKDKMKESIIAKLSKHADDLFSDVLKNMQKEGLRGLWDKEWVPVVSGKQALYNGLAQYHQSRVCNAEKAIGALARDAVVGQTHATESGGLSGAPVFEPSNRVISAMRHTLGTDFPIIGVGGIDSASKAIGKIAAGADAVQLYTGFIYKGPALVRDAALALKNRQRSS
jgi:programmed cell death 6-interacting protein